MQWRCYCLTLLAGVSLGSMAQTGGSHMGYYRQPALHGNTLIFVSEGDLWATQTDQKVAHRLTSRRGLEDNVIISQDGQQVAFAANYDGAYEAYVMPVDGGIPRRVTFEQTDVRLQEWTKNGHILYATNHTVGPLGTWQLKEVDPANLKTQNLPLYNANQGTIDEAGHYLYFTRFGTGVSGDKLRAYRGGAQGQIWRYELGSQKEAQLLTPAGSGSDSSPMFYQGKVYYLSDKSGNPNLWSMNPDGSEKTQLTTYTRWPVRTPDLSDGKIVFQLGADLVLYTIADQSVQSSEQATQSAEKPAQASDSEARTQILPLQLVSDQPYRQSRWIKNPLDYESSTTLTPDGKRVVITARGKVAVATTDGTRLIEIQTPAHSRVKFARMSQDKKWVYAVCDASGEEQIWRFAADGTNDMKQITHQGHSIRWSLSESPDGKHLLTDDKDGHLWLVDAASGEMKQILDHGPVNDAFGTYRWSDDSRYLAVGTEPDNADRSTVILYDLQTGHSQHLTSGKYNSFSPDFSPDGKWLYFLSDRHFKAISSSPWRDRTSAPVFSSQTGIFAFALDEQADFPFQPVNELMNKPEADADTSKDEPEKQAKDVPDTEKTSGSESVITAADQAGTETENDKATEQKPEAVAQPKPEDAPGWDTIAKRLWQVPVAEGNYDQLRVGKQGLYVLREGNSGGYQLKSIRYAHRNVSVNTVSGGISRYALSQDREQLFIVWDSDGYVVPAGSSLPGRMSQYRINANQWHMQVNPVDEWLQMFHSAWLMHRDMFYDPSMRGVDWKQVKTWLEPLVARVSDRYELSDLLGQMTSQLNALHSQVSYGEDTPGATDTAEAASLGAALRQTAQGVVVEHIYQTDPEVPEMASPLAKPGVDAENGDLILEINKRPVASLADVSQLLRNQSDQQVLLTLSRAGEKHQVIVYPVGSWQSRTFAWQDWAEKNQQRVREESHHQIGYIYLHAMIKKDVDTFVREFYANIDKQGLIIDVRNNQGGNIDSWILDKLMRRAWMYWKPRHGGTYTNMQQAFRGHIAVLANQMTYSDGETFTAGVKALGLGPVIGMRTFGAGVWLDDSNKLTDWGKARVAEYPQYSMDGEWLIEQHGVTPTIEVDNLPYATYQGHDAQLQKALEYLKEKITESPVAPLNPVMKAGQTPQAGDIHQPVR
ncbi:S41 family peptidase [Vibrio quintilis]|uniref:Tricorn protease homolog n=1 Tax=Vibrio quintilis TaxID=1117707 RepID=A0A1M7YQN5_9VIBR|nr:S41 family peptidase [Vibrio quintilis]SHO54944.1 hypothetical protein VQ7734_00663 [Vibrio quintilis]